MRQSEDERACSQFATLTGSSIFFALNKAGIFGMLMSPIRNLFISMDSCSVLICYLELSISEISWVQTRLLYDTNRTEAAEATLRNLVLFSWTGDSIVPV
jgi:hypothetical protein